MSLSKFAGIANAYDYAYGVNPNVPPLVVVGGGAAAGGTYSVTVALGTIALADGTVVSVLSTTAPISIGQDSNVETVTPSSVSYANDPVYGPVAYVTATYSNGHAQGDRITSATYGLEEAVNAQHAKGGVVVVDGAWAFAGGVTATITGNKGFTNVCIVDNRGTASGSAFSFKVSANGSDYAATTISWY
jgi:hypothetical protein